MEKAAAPRTVGLPPIMPTDGQSFAAGRHARGVQRVRVLVSGVVQGVWFRESTRAEADRRGIAGWVRNLPDGRVEAAFEGPGAAVEAMVAWCHRGPERASVERVEAHAEEPQGETGPFSVRR
jgi:acylphosphatase